MILFWESSDLKGRSFPVVMRKPNLPHALLRILSQRFLKASRRILWKSLTSGQTKIKTFVSVWLSSWTDVKHFCNRDPACGGLSSLLEVKQFTNSFEVFFQPFQNFSSKGNLKAARGATGNKFSGVVPPLFP